MATPTKQGQGGGGRQGGGGAGAPGGQQQAPPAQPQGQGAPTAALARQQTLVNNLARLIESRKDAFKMVAGEHFNTGRLVKMAHGVLTRTPALAECNPATVLVCLMRCAELGLEPDSALPQRRMWLVPRKNRKLKEGKECTYQIDYRAKLQLARDTGLVKDIVANVVRQKDHFVYEQTSDGDSITKLEFKPNPFASDEERGPVIGYFAAAKVAGHALQAVVWSKAKAEKHRDQYAPRSSGEYAGPWWDNGGRDFDKMALKSLMHELWNLLPAGETAAAQKLQRIAAEERDQDEGGKTAAIDLGIIAPEEMAGTTADEVEKALAGGKAAGEAAGGPQALDAGVDPPSMEKKSEEKKAEGKAEPGSDG